MTKPFAVLAVAGFAAAYASSSTAVLNILNDCLSPGTFVLILVYAGILVLARYSPGQCMYRFLVLRSPHRHGEARSGRRSTGRITWAQGCCSRGSSSRSPT